MDLRTFVKETLAAIVGGVLDAQEELGPKGAHVNPTGLTRTTKSIGEDSIWDNSENNFARNVAFDVAVTLEEGAKTQAKIGVLSGIIGASAGGESSDRQVAVSRVSFVIPVLFPGSSVGGARATSAASTKVIT